MALGKGLDAIFGDNVDQVLEEINNGEREVEGKRFTLKISSIRPNPYQPRKNFDDESLKQLASSIKERGIFQPILVRKSLKGYELIAGERRLKASKMAGLKEIPAVVLDGVDDKDMMEVSLLENIQREDLNPIEEAQAYEQIIKKLDYTQDELAKRVSKSRAYITNTLRLLKLPKKVQDMLSNGKLSYGHGRALLSLEEEDKIIELANKIVKEDLTVRQVEKLVSAKPKKTKTKKGTEEKDPYLIELRKNLEEKLSTKVEVEKKKMIIHYTNNDDLNRILEIIDCLFEE